MPGLLLLEGKTRCLSCRCDLMAVPICLSLTLGQAQRPLQTTVGPSRDSIPPPVPTMLKHHQFQVRDWNPTEMNLTAAHQGAAHQPALHSLHGQPTEGQGCVPKSRLLKWHSDASIGQKAKDTAGNRGKRMARNISKFGCTDGTGIVFTAFLCKSIRLQCPAAQFMCMETGGRAVGAAGHPGWLRGAGQRGGGRVARHGHAGRRTGE